MTDPVPKPTIKTFENSKGMFNPYDHLEDNDVSRVSADIDKHDFNLIKSVTPPRGVIQEMTNMFFKAVVDEMRLKGIQHYDPTGNNERAFIAIIRRRAAPWSPEHEHRGVQNTGGDGSVRDETVSTPYVPADPPRTTGGRGGRGGRKTKAKS